MGIRQGSIAGIAGLIAVAFSVAAGCNWSSNQSADERAREEKTREEVAKATEKAKPALEEASREIKQAANEAANQAQAAVKGARDGWNRGARKLINVNAATESELLQLPGISRRDARRIVEARPYEDKHDMVVKGVISEAEYERIRDRITSK
jgi:DNA uptake protein ComE-like DNA-binding protein